MRWNSVGGTRPAKIKDSVPRLSAPHVERTRISPGPGEVTFSVRNSTRLGPLYQSACPVFSPMQPVIAAFIIPPDCLRAFSAAGASDFREFSYEPRECTGR